MNQARRRNIGITAKTLPDIILMSPDALRHGNGFRQQQRPRNRCPCRPRLTVYRPPDKQADCIISNGFSKAGSTTVQRHGRRVHFDACQPMITPAVAFALRLQRSELLRYPDALLLTPLFYK